MVRFSLVLLLGGLLLVGASPAAAETVDADLQAALHLKILSFDKALGKRVSGSKLVIAVLYNDGSARSKSEADDIKRAFKNLGGSKRVTVKGKSVTAVLVPMGDGISDRMSDAGAGAMYVAPGLDSSLSTIASVAKRRSLPTLSGQRRHVENGIAVGVVPKGGKPRIVLNLKAAKAAGMALDTKIVRLAELIR